MLDACLTLTSGRVKSRLTGRHRGPGPEALRSTRIDTHRRPRGRQHPEKPRSPACRPTSRPITFSDDRLANGLRVIVAEDHLAPVVAINLWYDVGSKHEQPGRTGFAHLFEHVMFQGSRHVGKAEHIAIVQAAGGTMNGSTWLDRTNYFETLPAHQLELGLWLEADRMATLPDALSQENLDNQREVVKNEKRSSYDNRPYGSWQEKVQGHLFPPEHPYHHSTIGSMDDLNAASLDDVISFFRTWYAPNNAVLSIVGDVDTAAALAAAERYFGGIPANPSIPPLGDLSLPPTLGGRGPRDRPRPRPAAAGLHRVPRTRLRRPAARRARHGEPDPGRGAGAVGWTGGSSATERIAQDVALFSLGFVGGGSIVRRLGDRPARGRSDSGRGGVPRGARAADQRAGHRRRAGPRPGARRGR